MSRKRNQRAKRNRGVEKKLAAYGLAAGAALSCAENAPADILHTVPDNTIIITSVDPYALDINGDINVSIPDVSFSATIDGSPAQRVKAAVGGGIVSLTSTTSSDPISMRIGPSNVWLSTIVFATTTTTTEPIQPKGYIGVKFFIDDDTHYGWVAYEYELADDTSWAKISEWAYEDTAGQSIVAGDTGAPVPEPGTAGLALLALGAAAGFRRWQNKKETA